MKNWNNYKQTYRSESDIFDFARSGDLRGFANLLSQNPNLDLDAKNSKGYSALMLAVYNDQQDFCETLLRGGADANSMDSIGNTVLMACAYKGNLTLLKLLLHFGALTTYENKSKMNVRDWAKMFGREDIIHYLDDTFPSAITPSKFTSILKFIKLGFIMLSTKIKRDKNH